jgi:hypothetical protein
VSCRNGKIETAEVHSAEEAAFSATLPGLFACGSADSIEQAWGIRDKVADIRDQEATTRSFADK